MARILQTLAQASSNRSIPLAIATAFLDEAKIIELPELGVERSLAQAAVDVLRGRVIINEATGIRARLSSSARGKLVSNKATGKSKANGFSPQQHNAIVARIAEIYESAILIVSRPDRAGDANILSIKRFATKVRFGCQLAVAWITVKESKLHGNHIYSVEAIKLEALDRIVEVVSGNTPHASSAPTRNIVSFFAFCVNAVFGKIFNHRRITRTIAAALLLLAPSSRAGSVWDAVEAGDITWTKENAATNWFNGDFIISFTNVNSTSTLHLPGFARVWALVVGGGGAGGDRGGSNISKAGGGGGGGAGGFVETNNLIIAGGDYSITVGAGGAVHYTAVTSGAKGNSGLASSISDIMTAAGGGGGSYKSKGGAGASGGGGSATSSTIKGNGGNAEPAGQGFVGGIGSIVQVGAGGGGAGGAGGDTGDGVPGNGGFAKSSTITGTEVWYAGGGGGGSALGDGGLGGGTSEDVKKGGGGNGGYAKTALPMPGTDGLGGGGGGAGINSREDTSPYAIGAKGGDGVVIIRISFVIDGPIEKPKDGKKYLYTGEEIVADKSIPGVYEVTGENVATNVREAAYVYTTTLESGLTWADDTDDPVTVGWYIVPGTNAIPTQLFESVVYDGKNHPVVYPVAGASFVAGSVTSATNVGEYSYTVALDDPDNYRWPDGSVTNKTFNWSITPAHVAVPEPLCDGVVFDWANHLATTNSAVYSFVGVGTGNNQTNATDAGDYHFEIELNDKHNWRWDDESVTNQTVRWSIARMPVDYPPIPGDDGKFTYDGTWKTAATNTIYYSVDDEGEVPPPPARKYAVRALDQGNYYFAAVLKKNWCWKADGSTEPHTVYWRILQAQNAIIELKMSDWQVDKGPNPNEPAVIARFGGSDARYSYGKSTSGPWKQEMPATTGVFYVRAVISATGNWTGAEKTKRFLVYKGFDEIFTDYVDLEMPSATAQGVDNHHLLVRISETIFRGFSYARCPSGDDLAFMDLTEGQDKAPLAFDVDTWNPDGDSYVWVKLPRMAANTKVRMYWHIREGMEPPGSDPVETWDGYAGVWHFNETITREAASTNLSHDATGNGYDAMPRKAASSTTADLRDMISTAGRIGNARVNAKTGYNSGGNNLVVSNFAGCALGSSFIFEGWVKFDGYGSNGQIPWIVARKARDEEGGWAMALNGGSTHTKLNLYGRGTSPNVTADIASTGVAGDWLYVFWAVNGSDYRLITHSRGLGDYDIEGELADSAGDDLLPLVFGCDLSNDAPSVNGKFDEFRLRPWNPVTLPDEMLAGAAVANYANVTNPTAYVSHGWIVQDGMKQNYWLREPSISPTHWEKGEGHEGKVDSGKAAVGEVKVTFRDIFKGGSGIPSASEQDNPTASHPPLPTEAGNYIATFTVTVDGFDQLLVEIPFVITAHEPRTALGATEGGRTLLANDDSTGDWVSDTAITNQAYYQTRYVDYTVYDMVVFTNEWSGRVITNWNPRIITTTNSTYWIHSEDSTHDAELRPYLLTNSVHTLMTTNVSPALCGGTRLWHLNQVRIGNLYNPETIGERYNYFNYLPWSSTSCAISTNGPGPITQQEIGNMMLRNTTEACIYSPCYSGGIGTIYFDAANFQADGNPAYHHLVVEVATNVLNGSAIPSDQNLTVVETNNLSEVEADESVLPDVKTNVNYKLADWQAVSVVPRRFIGGVCTTDPATKDLVLNMTAGGTHSNFYRFAATLNWNVPARFRIKRKTCEELYSGTELGRDSHAQILLDNIIASEPNMVKGATAANGWFDLEKRGKQALGYENTWETPFPALGDKIIARAELDGGGSNYVTKAVMHYRERYLNQRIGSVWREVVLNPYDGFKAMEPLQLSGLPGDIEFYFTSDLQAPFYDYVDYSGTGFGVPGFKEEISTVENHCTDLDAATSQSRGSEWYVRIREGRSDWEGLVLRTDASDPERKEIQMELVSDHIWRGYFKTVDGIAGGVRYRIEPRNLQTPGSRGFAMNTNYWYAADDAQRLPVSAILRTDGTTNSWSRIPCDGTTGYLMFQVDDSTKSISVVHADYQDFDLWNDANKKPPVFVGNSTVDGKKSGVSPKMQEFTEEFTRNGRPWAATPSGNVNWNESFDTEASLEFDNYVPFGSATTLGGWVCGPGMFVDEWYKHAAIIPNPGGTPRRALQMEGCGKGSIQFPPAVSPVPRGLAEIGFTARLGQFIDLDADISFAEVPGEDTMVTKNYAFVTLAAFDLNSNKDFAGNASISLFAYYRVRKGAYEVRLEQVGADVSGSTVTGPNPKSRRLTLYRWTPDNSGKVTAIRLSEKDITFPAVETQGELGKYMPFYISCETKGDATVIRYGVWRKDAGGTEGTGFPYNEENMAKLSNGPTYCNCVYVDSDNEHRLKSGTYGVLSANCDGVFLRPHVSHEPITTDAGNDVQVAFPSLTDCQEDIVDEDGEEPWNVNPGRMEAFSTGKFQWGIQASPVSQTLDLQIAPRGTTKWTTIRSFTFNDFGAEGKSGTPCSHRLDRTDDLEMRLVVRGSLDDPRTDIVVDNLTFTQWRGCDYGDKDTSSFVAPNDGSGWRTNFTFSSAWVKNEVEAGKTNATVLLSAKRTADWTTGAKASAIRSPLMDGGDGGKRGIGLGLFSFGYRNAQENARLLVQIATNNITSSALGYDTIDDKLWTTVSNVNFTAMSETERKSGTVSVYLGLHGVKGLMRVCVDPEVVREVSPSNWLDQAEYGEVEITSVYCRDEPPLDLTAWWGWNLQTTDNADRQYLVDNAKFPSGTSGLSLGLNRGIRQPEDNVEDDPETYKRQMPFVQTPLFESNTVGEITFRARQYELTGQRQYAEVALYGANFRPGTHELDWKCSPADPPLARFIVSNTTYTTYTYKTKPGDGYKAFRLGVTGITAVDYETRGPKPLEGETPVRVLIDEVLVSEAIRPEMGFRSCRPIRSQLTTSAKVLTAGAREEQPILGDAWSVQAEIEVRLLPDEIDLETPGHEPRVFFHWFRGESPWGFAAWKDTPVDPLDKNRRGTAELKRAEGEEMVFKGSYIDTPGAVVMADQAATYTYRIYQYAAEVVYWDVKGNCITGVLNSAEWTRPEWYAPLDLNAKYGGGTFAAYNILESVSPGRAWINEANIFDGKTPGNDYPADKNQYVEIAVPITQSLENWKLYYIDHNLVTNLLCVFGQSSITSSKSANATNDYVFLTVQSPLTKRSQTLDAAKGEVDGTWKTFGGTDTNGELDQLYPIGLRLVRPSGIVAQEIVMEGTNIWAGSMWGDDFSAEAKVKELNEEDPEKQWYAVGNEYGGLATMSLGVTNLDVTAARASAVTPEGMWWNRGAKTPGRVNAGQVIPKGYAIFPSGDMVLVNATVTGPHILQTVGEVTNSTLSVLVATPKDGGGTNITYRLDSPWFEVGEIRENGVLKAEGGADGFVFAAGKGTSESVVTVTASARPRKDLREKYGLGPDNPYMDAVLKWLVDGQTLKGPFAYPGSIDLPIYRDYAGNYVTNLTLTETYWFDIDPTGSNWCYQAGTSKIGGGDGKPEIEVHFSRGPDGRPVYDPTGTADYLIKTNIRMEVMMVITNESVTGSQAGLHWSPYVLRSKAPGLNSQMYASGQTNRWDSVNFKITADVLNGMPLRQKWVPLRYFVFREGSFDANNRSTIDIPHPFSADSLSVNYGWKSYSAHPEKKWSLGYGWSIDSRIAPVAIEVLAPTNAITW